MGNEGRNEQLYSVEVAVSDGEGTCGKIDRAVVNVVAENEGRACAVKIGSVFDERSICEGMRIVNEGPADEGTKEPTKNEGRRRTKESERVRRTNEETNTFP